MVTDTAMQDLTATATVIVTVIATVIVSVIATAIITRTIAAAGETITTVAAAIPEGAASSAE